MVVGFNHNFRYNGEIYHIQTEDSGLKSPNIVTLLYQGGTILASKKMSYADIAKVDNLDKVVEELMKEQHKDMLRKLKAGEFDGVIERFKAGKKLTPLLADEVSAEPPQAAVVPSPAPVAAVFSQAVVASKPEPRQAAPAVAKPPASPTLPGSEASSSKAEIGLDDVILSYLLGDDKEPGPRR